MRTVLLVAACGLIVGACAKDSESVGSAYVSPVPYESYTCTQLGQEAERVSARAMQASGVQDNRATNDKVAMGVGLIVFWPALFLTKGNDETTAELARLKGTMDAIEQVSIRKNCGIIFKHPPPPEPAMAADRNGEYH
jgi:hypothetical protein